MDPSSEFLVVFLATNSDSATLLVDMDPAGANQPLRFTNLFIDRTTPFMSFYCAPLPRSAFLLLFFL